jgi:branched-chain amino acid transport system substrate-binding protein
MSLRKEASPTWKHTWTTSFAIATPAEAGDFRANESGYTMMGPFTQSLKTISDQTNKKIAALASDDADGRGWYQAFTPVMKQLGFTVDGADKEFGIVPVNTTDFSPLIKQWMANGDDTLWANTPGVFFGTMWRQAVSMGFKPKLVFASRAGLFYDDVNAWGGELPNQITNEHFWDPNMTDCPGIGATTPKSLDERWTKETNKPTHTMMATGYMDVQVLLDAIDRAGSIDKEKVNTALAKTDVKTIYGRVVFDKDNFSRLPISFAQWVKTDKSYKWDNPVVISTLPQLKVEGKLAFPIQYK